MKIPTKKLNWAQTQDLHLDGLETPNIYNFEGLKAQPAGLRVQRRVDAAGRLVFQGYGD